MSQHFGSPLVHVMTQPLSVISHLHMPIVMLQQHTIMPFIIMQQLHIPPAIIMHRFCIMLHAIESSHTHVIFIPPVHFSNFMVQRGTIIMFIPVGMLPMPIPGVPIPVAPMPVIMLERSIIIVPVIFWLLFRVFSKDGRSTVRKSLLPTPDCLERSPPTISRFLPGNNSFRAKIPDGLPLC
jgi:hypothetical protein